MEPGPIQKAWLKELRDHPERQIRSVLGEKDESGECSYCCLGQYLTVYNQINNIPQKWTEACYLLSNNSRTQLVGTYETLGLRDEYGKLETVVTMNGREFINLAYMNDGGITWPEIADYVENNPDNVFVKSL